MDKTVQKHYAYSLYIVDGFPTYHHNKLWRCKTETVCGSEDFENVFDRTWLGPSLEYCVWSGLVCGDLTVIHYHVFDIAESLTALSSPKLDTIILRSFICQWRYHFEMFQRNPIQAAEVGVYWVI